MARCRVTSNLLEVAGQFDEMAAAFAAWQGARLRILNEVAYFIWVEYGTSKMEARSMVRNSVEPILDMFDQLWAFLPWPFFPDDIETLLELLKPYAIDQIVKRTPRVTGALQAGFVGEVERY